MCGCDVVWCLPQVVIWTSNGEGVLKYTHTESIFKVPPTATLCLSPACLGGW